MAKKSHRYNHRRSAPHSGDAPASEIPAELSAQGEQTVPAPSSAVPSAPVSNEIRVDGAQQGASSSPRPNDRQNRRPNERENHRREDSRREHRPRQEHFKQKPRQQGQSPNAGAQDREKFRAQERRNDGSKGNWRQDRLQSPPPPEFVPTHGGAERPEELEALRAVPLEAASAGADSAQPSVGAPRRGIPTPLRYDDPPYVPDKPARGSDEIFFKDFEPLYSGARGLAIKILSRLDQSDSYLDKLLEHELAHSDLKPIDRALLTELVHGVTRWQAKLDWVLTGFYHGEFVKCIVPVKNAMRIALYQIMFLQRIPPFLLCIRTRFGWRRAGYNALAKPPPRLFCARITSARK